MVLAPCIISSICCNFIWRRKIGYDRPFVRQVPSFDEDSLGEELEFITSAQRALAEDRSGLLSRFISDQESIASAVEFVVRNDLFEDLCVHLVKDAEISTIIFGPSNETLTIDSQSLWAIDERSIPRLLEIVRTCVNERGPTCLKYRERYLLEMLGCYLGTVCVVAPGEKIPKSAMEA